MEKKLLTHETQGGGKTDVEPTKEKVWEMGVAKENKHRRSTGKTRGETSPNTLERQKANGPQGQILKGQLSRGSAGGTIG